MSLKLLVISLYSLHPWALNCDVILGGKLLQNISFLKFLVDSRDPVRIYIYIDDVILALLLAS